MNSRYYSASLGLTNSLLGLFKPSNLILSRKWRDKHGRSQRNNRDDYGPCCRIPNLFAQKPGRDCNLKDIGPEFMNLSHSTANDVDL